MCERLQSYNCMFSNTTCFHNLMSVPCRDYRVNLYFIVITELFDEVPIVSYTQRNPSYLDRLSGKAWSPYVTDSYILFFSSVIKLWNS